MQSERENSSVISITVMFSSVMFRSVMLVQLSPCRNDSPSPLPRLYRECRHRSGGTTVNAVPIPAITAVSVIKFNPIRVQLYLCCPAWQLVV